MDKEVQILIDGRVIKINAEPFDMFSIINGLILQQKVPQVRYFDEELNDWTCWQHTTPEIKT